MDSMETWKLPPRDEISFYQRARDNMKVWEIIAGESREGQIEQIIEEFWENWKHGSANVANSDHLHG